MPQPRHEKLYAEDRLFRFFWKDGGAPVDGYGTTHDDAFARLGFDEDAVKKLSHYRQIEPSTAFLDQIEKLALLAMDGSETAFGNLLAAIRDERKRLEFP